MTINSHLRTSLQQKIRSSIPLSEMMQFEIEEISSRSITVHAPLKPNINIHGTGFAGSLYSIGVLTGWALADHLMSLSDMKGTLVVAGAEIKYRTPVTQDIKCSTSVSDRATRAFVEEYKANGKGRLQLSIHIGTSKNAILLADFVAISVPATE